MARFFFDFHDGGQHPLDREGIDLDDARAARREAIQTLVQAMFYEAGDQDSRSISCQVRDESGKVIYLAGINMVGGWVSDQAVEPA